VPWLLYGVGALIAISMQMIQVPALAFALGMYIPLELNVPLVVGGLVAHSCRSRPRGTSRWQRPQHPGHADRLRLHRAARSWA